MLVEREKVNIVGLLHIVGTPFLAFSENFCMYLVDGRSGIFRELVAFSAPARGYRSKCQIFQHLARKTLCSDFRISELPLL